MEVSVTSLSHTFRFRNGAARNAARIPEAQWDEHKELLCSLYREKTVAEVLAFMQAQHAFVANPGQLSYKLKKWGVYKYDCKNRPLDPAFPPSECGTADDSSRETLADAAPRDLLAREEVPVQPESVSDPSTVPAEGAPSDIVSEAQPLLSTDESLGPRMEMPELVEAPDHRSLSLNSEAHREASTSTGRIMLPLVQDPDNWRLSDIDMDRCSATSPTPSSLRGFKALARRISQRLSSRRPLERHPVNDIPSSVMQWDRSSARSLLLFGQFSNRMSVASSTMRDAPEYEGYQHWTYCLGWA